MHLLAVVSEKPSRRVHLESLIAPAVPGICLENVFKHGRPPLRKLQSSHPVERCLSSGWEGPEALDGRGFFKGLLENTRREARRRS